MKVKIVANHSNDYYDKFIGKTYDVLKYDKIYMRYTLPIASLEGDMVTYWYHGEVEIIEQ